MDTFKIINEHKLDYQLSSTNTSTLLDPEEFRRQGHMMVDFLADYFHNIEKYPIRSKMLSVGLNVVGFSWIASPAAAELENIVTDWLGKLMSSQHIPFSGGGGGVIQDPNSLTKVLSTTPECLRNKATDSKDVIDYKDWQISLSRRFRALKL
ncbi:hypothetical protein H5410_041128 [Solanum commersonii]|uniref:Uncharacterized protein n=1 Tax=Solanum commersonii TaxID=4109 RepID=A0A9J5XUJ9_SOLCO|nr:hypothetical protein H5410_041128 [Solanum commersonii]